MDFGSVGGSEGGKERGEREINKEKKTGCGANQGDVEEVESFESNGD